MISVRNTKELEVVYNLNSIPDDELISVTGGLTGKAKYQEQDYYRRTTYPARQLKQIIAQMRAIENEMSPKWNDWQKAKFIYETLANNISYNHNREEYKTQQSSNLSILLSRKGICAGYSLLFKEMMDRQGIPCEYVRGKGISDSGNSEKHAWNVLHIGGYSFPVDLTWDSTRCHKGVPDLYYFGTDVDFAKHHIPDNDERPTPTTVLDHRFVSAINTDRYDEPIELDFEDKMRYIQNAIEQTYIKFEAVDGPGAGKNQIAAAIMSYIKDGDSSKFTRTNMSRQSLIDNVTPDDMLNVLVHQYVANPQRNLSILSNSVAFTQNKYDAPSAENALRKYITKGNADSFTRDGAARDNILDHISPEAALQEVVCDLVEREARAIEYSRTQRVKNVYIDQNHKFAANEFGSLKIPKEKEKGLISKAISWIKGKVREKHPHKPRRTHYHNKPSRSRNVKSYDDNER